MSWMRLASCSSWKPRVSIGESRPCAAARPTNSRIFSRLCREYRFFFTGLIDSGFSAGGRNPRQPFRLYRLSRVVGTASSPKTHASHVQRSVSNSMVLERSRTLVDLDRTELAESISSAADELLSSAIARSMLLTLPEDRRSSSFSCKTVTPPQ